MRIFVTEFAESKKEIERELSHHTSVILEHLEKLVYMPNHDAVNHWEGEIYGQLSKVPKLMGKNRFPSAKQIYAWTWGKWGDVITIPYIRKTIKEIEYEYNYNSDMKGQEFMDTLIAIGEDYFQWLAKELSETGKVTSFEVYKKLDELIGR